ncbi:MAG: TauD/TfdA family dioxygenase [Spirochaetaceae bacterium]|nr:TauD/TfdA family dioxygenase [Spirochaetaceae bacterium]
MLTITPESAALGAVVSGLDLRAPLEPADASRLRDALLRHEVLFFPEAGLSPAEQVRLGRVFGELQTHAALDALPEQPEVVVFDTDRKAVTAEWWHTDVTCSPRPPMGAMLQMVIAPPAGGDTWWASMTAAYEALDADTKARIDGLHALHRSWWQPVEESIHPVVRTHPESGRKALFVNGIFTKRIVELEEVESDALLASLLAHATRDEFTVRHAWRSGDIAFWDNRCTQHRVDNDFGDARRCGHRVAIDGDAPR